MTKFTIEHQDTMVFQRKVVDNGCSMHNQVVPVWSMDQDDSHLFVKPAIPAPRNASAPYHPKKDDMFKRRKFIKPEEDTQTIIMKAQKERFRLLLEIAERDQKIKSLELKLSTHPCTNCTADYKDRSRENPLIVLEELQLSIIGFEFYEEYAKFKKERCNGNCVPLAWKTDYLEFEIKQLHLQISDLKKSIQKLKAEKDNQHREIAGNADK